jgi:putative ABC transport system substrate-binding protein
MRRRDFLGVLGGAAVTWPLAARARQSATPVIGFLSIRSQGDEPRLLTAFHQGLKEVDYVVGQNVTMEYRWAEGQSGRLPAMAADLVHREVAVIAATPSVAVRQRRRPRPFQSSLKGVPTPSRSGSSPALTGRAATSRA